MRLNWMSNSYPRGEGYGRYSAAMILALIQQGIDVMPVLRDHLTMPDWMLGRAAITWKDMTIACMPPYYLPDKPFPGRIWLLTMTEGGRLPEGWAEFIHDAAVERVIVPCEHNRKVFVAELGVAVHIIPGGTDPYEFPVAPSRNGSHPYTFLSLADRGSRKGWTEVWTAFYQEFGRPEDTPDVNLIVKCRPDANHVLNRIKPATTDPRINIWIEETDHPSQVWPSGDCVVIPSRSEGWGMPHREAAMMGIPVITTRYSGLDDGYLDEWAIPLDKYSVAPAGDRPNIAGDWVFVDVDELRQKMRWCYENREAARQVGERAARWLRENQTWDQAAEQMVALLKEHGAWQH